MMPAERDEHLKRTGKRPNEHHMELPGWKGVFWRREPDPFTISRDEAPVLFEPGERVHYSNPGVAMLGYVITAALQQGADKDIRTLLQHRIMQPLGIDNDEWRIWLWHDV